MSLENKQTQKSNKNEEKIGKFFLFTFLIIELSPTLVLTRVF
jgi:hypothetical protein